MDPSRVKADLELALTLADLVDEVTMARFRASDLKVDTKPDDTPVTEADRAAEQVLRQQLASHRPDDAIIGEEFGFQGGGERCWILDPIDGTKNYLRAVPVWCTLIGLTAGSDLASAEPVVGVVSAPALGRRWWAGKGHGAFTRDVDGTTRAISVSGVRDLADASFSYSDREGWAERDALGMLDGLEDACWRTRAYGDFLSHVLVAEGCVDVAAEPLLAPWDMAALIPVVEEAGGRVTGLDGSRPLAHLSAVTTNARLHDDVLGLI